MHFLDRYALNTGAKIDKPFVYQKFFPLPFDRYITFQPISKPAKNYDYWQDVLDDIAPYLTENNIRIVQIGAKDEHRFIGPVHLQGITALPQAAYLINRAMLHIGVDSFGTHMASAYDVPLVSLYSNGYIQNCGPVWGDKDKQILFSPDFSEKKPSFAFEENPKAVNTIKSEKVSAAILDLLGIKHNINYETVFVGKQYSNTAMFTNICPSDQAKMKVANGMEVRMDLNHDEKFLEVVMQRCNVAVITKKPISLELLKKYKKQIGMLFFMVEDESGVKFVRDAISLGVSINLISNLPQDKLDELKSHYYDIGMIGKLPEIDDEDKKKILAMPKNSLKFKSNKTYLKGEHVYYNRLKMDQNKGAKLPEYQDLDEIPSDFFEDFQFQKIIKTS
jgi:hypothetical protein